MIKPFRPYEPIKPKLEKIKEEEILASKYYINADDDDSYNNIRDDLIDQDESCIDHNHLINHNTIFSLQDILDLYGKLPQNSSPERISVIIDYDCNYLRYMKVSIVNNIYFSDSELKEKQILIDKQYDLEMKDFNAKLAVYSEKLIKYNEFSIKNKIKECEEELNMLKSKLK